MSSKSNRIIKIKKVNRNNHSKINHNKINSHNTINNHNITNHNTIILYKENMDNDLFDNFIQKFIIVFYNFIYIFI